MNRHKILIFFNVLFSVSFALAITLSFRPNALAKSMINDLNNSQTEHLVYLPFIYYSEVYMESVGNLDPSFGSDGKVVTNFSKSYDGANAIALQPDGKILAVGFFSGTDRDFALTRYNTDGSLDTGFGANGQVITNYIYNPNNGEDVAYAVALQPDGHIIVAGDTLNCETSYDFGLSRYNPDGTLDTSFDGDGLVTTDLDGDADYARSSYHPIGWKNSCGWLLHGQDTHQMERITILHSFAITQMAAWMKVSITMGK